jgi:hypothetical protein
MHSVGGANMNITIGATVYTGQLPTSWNIEATATGTVGSINFQVTGSANQSNTENVTPYRMPSDTGPLNPY